MLPESKVGVSNNVDLVETVIKSTGSKLELTLAPKSTSRFAFAANRKESNDPLTPMISSPDPLRMIEDPIITPEKLDDGCEEQEEVDSVPEKEILADWGGFLNTIPTGPRDPGEAADILQTIGALGTSDNKPHTSSSLNSLLSPATADTRDTYNRAPGVVQFNDYYRKDITTQGLLLFDIPPKVAPEKGWWYLDSESIKGPFGPEEMEAWYKRGYLKDDLLIRHGTDEDFYPVRDYIKDFKSFIPRKQSKSDLLKRVAAREYAPMSFELTRIGSESFSQDLISDAKIAHSHSDRKDSYYSNMQSKHRPTMSGGKSMADSYDYVDDKGKNKKKNKKRKIIRTISMQTGEDDIFVAEVKFVKIKKTTDNGCQTEDPNNQYGSFNSPASHHSPGNAYGANYGVPIPKNDMHPIVHPVHQGHGGGSMFMNALFHAADVQGGGPVMMKPPENAYDPMHVAMKYQMMVPGDHQVGGDRLEPCEEYVDEEQKYYEEDIYAARRFKSHTVKGYQPHGWGNMEEDEAARNARSVSFAGPQFSRPRSDYIKPKRRSGYVNYEAVYSAKS